MFEGRDSVPLSAEPRRPASKVSVTEGPALPTYPLGKGIPNATPQPESASIPLPGRPP